MSRALELASPQGEGSAQAVAGQFPPETDRAAEPRTFLAFGKPAPQGSKVRNRYGGVREDNERTEPWRQTVMAAVFAAGLDERLDGPVAVDVRFTFDKPKTAPKTRRSWPTTRATCDVDKLLRAIFDALTAAGVWRDDSQVVSVTASKVYVGDDSALAIPGAAITVWALPTAAESQQRGAS